MNISSGISEISINRLNKTGPAKETMFVWPVYTDGKVEKIRGITPRAAQPLYFKASPEEYGRIMETLKNSPGEYNAYGRSERSASHLSPGSLFNAIA